MDRNPQAWASQYNLGLILADQKDFVGALQELAKAISLMPGSAKPWLHAGRVLEAEGKTDAAIDAVRWASRLSPTDTAIRAELDSLAGTANSSRANSKIAAAGKKPELGSASDTADAHRAFARELTKSGDSLGAIGELLRTLALKPTSLDARGELAAAFELFGDHDRAALEYYKILRATPDDAEIHFALANTLLAVGDRSSAVVELRLALKYKPDSKIYQSALERALQIPKP